MDRTGNEENLGGAGRRRTPAGDRQHLDLTTITAYVDGGLDREERDGVAAHLAGCAACRQELAEISTTVDLLHDLPRYRSNRSFRLDPEVARRERGNVVWLGRYLSALPALRAATAAVALLFLGTIVADVVTEPETSPQQNFAVEQAPVPADRERAFIATATGAPAANLADETGSTDPAAARAGEAGDQTEADAPAAVQADETGDQSEAMEAAGDAAPAGAQSESQSRAAAIAPEPTETATPAPTATPLPTPTPPPAPTPTPVPQGFGSGIGDEFPWRVAEIIFGVTFLLLAVAVVALQRLRRRLQ